MDVSQFNPGMDLYEGNHLSVCRARLEPGVYCLMPRTFTFFDDLPGWERTRILNNATPDMGAQFIMGQLVMQENGGNTDPIDNGFENFLFILEGSVTVSYGATVTLTEEGFCYLPPHTAFSVREAAGRTARLLWIKKEYVPAPGLNAPEAFSGSSAKLTEQHSTHVLKKECLPFESDMRFDMGVNLLTYLPGVSFPRAEAHMCEHGCYFLQGRGGMWLNGEHHEVHADDFLYIAPCTPHYAVGYAPEPLRYLLFKEANRDYPLAYDKQ